MIQLTVAYQLIDVASELVVKSSEISQSFHVGGRWVRCHGIELLYVEPVLDSDDNYVDALAPSLSGHFHRNLSVV